MSQWLNHLVRQISTAEEQAAHPRESSRSPPNCKQAFPLKASQVKSWRHKESNKMNKCLKWSFCKEDKYVIINFFRLIPKSVTLVCRLHKLAERLTATGFFVLIENKRISSLALQEFQHLTFFPIIPPFCQSWFHCLLEMMQQSWTRQTPLTAHDVQRNYYIRQQSIVKMNQQVKKFLKK